MMSIAIVCVATFSAGVFLREILGSRNSAKEMVGLAGLCLTTLVLACLLAGLLFQDVFPVKMAGFLTLVGGAFLAGSRLSRFLNGAGA